VTQINRGDHRVVDARSNWFPIPAAVAASEETGTRSSAVHLSRAALVDRHTLGRLSAQVFVDRPGGGAPSDQQGRAGYDYDAEHDSISFWNNPAKAGLASTKIVQLTVLVEKEINGGNPPIPGNDEISPGVSWRLTRAAR
jgi:hypothetical protein